MSLTSHVKNPKSPIRHFLCDEFPNTRTFLASARKQVRQAKTIRPDTDVPWDIVGMALDYRIRYYFAVTPYKDLVAYKGASFLSIFQTDILSFELLESDGDTARLKNEYLEFFQSLDELMELTPPVATKLGKSEEDALNRHCVVLALMEEVRRTARLNGILATNQFNDAKSLIDIAEPHWVDDLRELSYYFYDNFNHLFSLSFVLNPGFDGSKDIGGADADMIVDGTLIDIKTIIKQEINPDWLRQILGYTLLDYSNRYQINGIGLYMSRQGILCQWDLEEALQVLRPENPQTIDELRRRFRELLESTSSLTASL